MIWMRGCLESPLHPIVSSGIILLGIHDARRAFTAGFALMLRSHRWTIIFHLNSVIRVPQSSLGASSFYVCDERSESLETTLVLASFMLWFLTYSKLFYLGIILAAGFLLLFLFLLFALQIREKNSFLVFFFFFFFLNLCHGAGGWKEAGFQMYLSGTPKTGILREL